MPGSSIKKKKKFKEKEKSDESHVCGMCDSSFYMRFSFLCLQMIKKMRFVYLIVFAFVACSCSLVEIGGTAGSQKQDVWVAPGTGDGNGGAGNTGKAVCYITGFDYPEGYDWRADRQAGSVKCSLVVFADMMPVMKIPVGESHEVGWEPDMHRIIDGHLYTDWSTASETVIKKDGQPLFRYSGREMICGMTCDGDDVYILGQNRSGSGFCYRKNGEPVLKKESGYVIGGLQHTSEGICFSYCEPINSGNGAGRYYFVKDGSVSQIAVREDIKKIWDVVFYNGEVCYISDMTGIDVPVAVCGEKMSAVNLPKSARMLACRFIPVSDNIIVEGVFSADGHTLTSGLWSDGVMLMMFDPGYTVSSMCTWQSGLCCLLSSSAAGAPAKIFRFGDMAEVPCGYIPAGNSPLAVVNGILNVGLSSVSGGKPIVWKDGSVQELDINGYISSVAACGPTLPMKESASCQGLQ